jgi:hypothetical protein
MLCRDEHSAAMRARISVPHVGDSVALASPQAQPAGLFFSHSCSWN